MTEISSKYKEIYRLYREGLTINQIARRPLTGDLSLKTVRNIIYRIRKHPSAPALEAHRAIYDLYLEGMERGGLAPWRAILYAYDHQPPVYASTRTVREAITAVQEGKPSRASCMLRKQEGKNRK